MLTKLIIESGSTKADWVFFDSNGEIDRTTSIGLNPKVIDSEKLNGIIASILNAHADLEIDHVYFYGAGVLNYEDVIQKAFANVLPNSQIEVYSDIVAAAHASSFKNKNLCILGTGSIIASFKKNELIETRLGYGYLIGDLCSGSEFGKILIRDFLRGDLPRKIEDGIQLKRSQATSRLYQAEFPNRFLASLFPLLLKYKETDYVQELIQKQIRLLDKHGFRRLENSFQKITFVGGVAAQLKEELTDYYGKEYQIEIIERPIDKLVGFHLKNLKK